MTCKPETLCRAAMSFSVCQRNTKTLGTSLEGFFATFKNVTHTTTNLRVFESPRLVSYVWKVARLMLSCRSYDNLVCISVDHQVSVVGVGADGKLPELADEKLPVPVQY